MGDNYPTRSSKNLHKLGLKYFLHSHMFSDPLPLQSIYAIDNIIMYNLNWYQAKYPYLRRAHNSFTIEMKYLMI